MDDLSDYSDEALLGAFASLTHRLHVLDLAWVREQRDLVQVEILRRMRSE